MPRQIPIVAAIILLLYSGSGIANYDTRDTAPQINNGLVAIWDACDRLFGPAPAAIWGSLGRVVWSGKLPGALSQPR